MFGLSSDTEALGIVMVEAMAMRVPVVTTDVGGTTELVKDGMNGLAVPPRDPGPWPRPSARSRPIRLAQRFSAAGRATVEAGFGSGRSADTIVRGLREYAGRTQAGDELRTGP